MIHFDEDNLLHECEELLVQKEEDNQPIEIYMKRDTQELTMEGICEKPKEKGSINIDENNLISWKSPEITHHGSPANVEETSPLINKEEKNTLIANLTRFDDEMVTTLPVEANLTRLDDEMVTTLSMEDRCQEKTSSQDLNQNLEEEIEGVKEILNKNYIIDSTIAILLENLMPHHLKEIIKLGTISDLQCIIADAKRKIPNGIIRKLLKRHLYAAICGVWNCHYYIILLKKDKNGHCVAVAILNSFEEVIQREQTQIIENAVMYHETTCRNICYPEVPQQERGTNSCGLFCVEYIRNLNEEILHDIFDHKKPKFDFDNAYVEGNRYFYVEIIKKHSSRTNDEIGVAAAKKRKVNDDNADDNDDNDVDDDDDDNDDDKNDNIKIIKRKKRKTHRKTHHCSQCDKKFTELKNKIRHQTSVHEKKKVRCEICQKDFSRPDALKTHQKKMHNITFK